MGGGHVCDRWSTLTCARLPTCEPVKLKQHAHSRVRWRLTCHNDAYACKPNITSFCDLGLYRMLKSFWGCRHGAAPIRLCGNGNNCDAYVAARCDRIPSGLTRMLGIPGTHIIFDVPNISVSGLLRLQARPTLHQARSADTAHAWSFLPTS